jgi:hypothetical protein
MRGYGESTSVLYVGFDPAVVCKLLCLVNSLNFVKFLLTCLSPQRVFLRCLMLMVIIPRPTISMWYINPKKKVKHLPLVSWRPFKRFMKKGWTNVKATVQVVL